MKRYHTDHLTSMVDKPNSLERNNNNKRKKWLCPIIKPSPLTILG